jgi:hypothetical protein
VIVSYFLGIAAAVLVLVIVVELLRRRRLRERHAIWWLIAGILGLVAGIFPETLGWAARLLGVEIPINLVFFVSIAILFVVCLQHSAELTDNENDARLMAEQVALQELRIRELEQRLHGSDLGN